MIHKYSQNGRYFVLDVNSGAVHLVDELAFRLLDFVPEPLPEACPEEALCTLSLNYAPEQIQEAYSELRQLWQAGQLFSVDDYDQFADKLIASPIKAMCLNVSHDCNLRCTYCFAGKGDYNQGRMVMSTETGKRAIDFLLQESGEREHLEVDFFGGEPLMNLDVVKEVVSYAQSLGVEMGKRFRFTITTNGMLLDDDAIDYINREMSNVVLSLDGSFDRALKERFSKTTVNHKPECRTCWAKFYCSGGCNANNMAYEGDILKPHTLSCELEKKRLECAISLKAALLEENLA